MVKQVHSGMRSTACPKSNCKIASSSLYPWISLHTLPPSLFFLKILTETLNRSHTIQHLHTSLFSFCPTDICLQVQALSSPQAQEKQCLSSFGKNLGFTAEPQHSNRCNRQSYTRQKAITKTAYSTGCCLSGLFPLSLKKQILLQHKQFYSHKECTQESLRYSSILTTITSKQQLLSQPLKKTPPFGTDISPA